MKKENGHLAGPREVAEANDRVRSPSLMPEKYEAEKPCFGVKGESSEKSNRASPIVKHTPNEGVLGRVVPAGVIGATPREIATDYIDRGWAPIPLPFKQKRPVGEEWQRLRIDRSTVNNLFKGEKNIGVLLGAVSGGLTDVDLDCPEAVIAAQYLLPSPTRTFGRASKLRSHYLYVTDLHKTQAKAAISFKDDDATLCEVRIGGNGKGALTVFPGSTHPSGEPITWDNDESVREVDGDVLIRSARRLAAAAILARRFPGPHNRHDAGLTLGGFLARCGFDKQEAESFARAVCVASNQAMDIEDVVRAVADSLSNHANGGRSGGLPKMREVFGVKGADKVAKWLRYAGVGFDGQGDVTDGSTIQSGTRTASWSLMSPMQFSFCGTTRGSAGALRMTRCSARRCWLSLYQWWATMPLRLMSSRRVRFTTLTSPNSSNTCSIVVCRILAAKRCLRPFTHAR